MHSTSPSGVSGTRGTLSYRVSTYATPLSSVLVQMCHRVFEIPFSSIIIIWASGNRDRYSASPASTLLYCGSSSATSIMGYSKLKTSHYCLKINVFLIKTSGRTAAGQRFIFHTIYSQPSTAQYQPYSVPLQSTKTSDSNGQFCPRQGSGIPTSKRRKLFFPFKLSACLNCDLQISFLIEDKLLDALLHATCQPRGER